MQNPKAVILARVSSKAQEDEGYSLDSQQKLLSEYCSRHELLVDKVFRIAETASKDQSRKVFNEMVDYIKKGKIQHLAVEKTDRLTRNLRDAVVIDDWLQTDPSRRLHMVKENLVLHKEAKSDVKFMWNIYMAVAKKYTDNLREEAMKGWAEKLAQGWLPAPPPPGYITITENGKRIHVPDPDTKLLVQAVFNKYLEPSQSIASITKEMEHVGLKTRKGRPHSKSAVQRMLSNPFYIGINSFNGKETPGSQDHLISVDIFEKVQRKMHRGQPTVYKKHNPVFKNLVRCSSCQKLITWQLQKGRYYGACQRTKTGCRGRKLLREDLLEETISRMLTNLVCPSQEIIRWTANSIRQREQTVIDAHNQEVRGIKMRLERLGRMDNDLYDDKLAGVITKERYEEKHEQFIVQAKELEDSLNKLGQARGVRLEQELVLLELSQKAAGLYEKKSPEKKRIIITKLFKNMIADHDSVSVKYTNFAQAIADKVQLTKEILGE